MELSEEPPIRGRVAPRWPFFVLRHYGRRPHYDLHLELDDVLLGWTLSAAPSSDPARRRFALRIADRPPDFGRFEGVLAPDGPGAGVVMVWDLGSF